MRLRRVGIFLAFFLMCRTAGAEALSIRVIDEMIREPKVTNIDSLMGRIPNYLKTFSLVRKSRNKAQFASDLYPRALVSTGDFFMAFSGDSLQKGYGTLEMIEFDRSQTPPSFRFATAHFPVDGAPMLGGSIRPYVKYDPVSCMSCHHGHPILDTYPLWPGLFNPTERMEFPEDALAFETFRRAAVSLPRYRYLPGLEDRHEAYGRLEQSNLEVTDAITRMMADRAVSQILASSQIDPYRAAIMALDELGFGLDALKPKQLLQLLPGHSNLTWLSFQYGRMKKEVRRGVKAYERSLAARQGISYYFHPLTRLTGLTLFPIKAASERAAQMRFILSRMGLAGAVDLEITNETGTFASNSGFGDITSYISRGIITDTASKYPSAAKFSEFGFNVNFKSLLAFQQNTFPEFVNRPESSESFCRALLQGVKD